MLLPPKMNLPTKDLENTRLSMGLPVTLQNFKMSGSMNFPASDEEKHQINFYAQSASKYNEYNPPANSPLNINPDD